MLVLMIILLNVYCAGILSKIWLETKTEVYVQQSDINIIFIVPDIKKYSRSDIGDNVPGP